MRQVEYRLWCNNKKEWKKDEWHLTPNGRIIDSNRQIEMKPESHFLSQFIGLSDKDGIKIFEGDILNQCNGSINGTQWMDKNYKVEHSPKGFNLPFFMWKDNGENNMDSTHWCEVIGNKFENPELLNTDID